AKPAPPSDAEVEAQIARFEGFCDGAPGESPYRVWEDLQVVMQNKAGMVRFKGDLEDALAELASIKKRAAACKAPGTRVFNPGWHVAMDLQSMVVACEASVRCALMREESRGGHTRGDFTGSDDAKWGNRNVVVKNEGGKMALSLVALPPIPAELKAIVDAKAEDISTKGAA